VIAGDFAFLVQAEKDGSFDPYIRINHSIAVFRENVKKFDDSQTNVNFQFVSVCRVVRSELSSGNCKGRGYPPILNPRY
jgi:hypothetical protein